MFFEKELDSVIFIQVFGTLVKPTSTKRSVEFKACYENLYQAASNTLHRKIFHNKKTSKTKNCFNLFCRCNSHERGNLFTGRGDKFVDTITDQGVILAESHGATSSRVVHFGEVFARIIMFLAAPEKFGSKTANRRFGKMNAQTLTKV